ncbi:MAG: GntR family transcriptional regulator [Bryobacteraceae bacterium]|nr:GntR family transcriptional regulator [Bryobacteraceae bacterium]
MSLKRKAYEYIRGKLLSGQLPAGAAISELALAQEIGISRTPVREAIGRLVAEGLLEHIPGRGTVVIHPTRRDIVELYELREALEVYAVGKAARQRLHAEDAAGLRRLCEQIRAMAEELRSSGRARLDENEMQRFLAADMKFHMLLLRAAGNLRIMKVVADTRLLTRIFSYRREGHDAALLEQIHQYHHDVLEAVEAGDAARAMERLGEHIRSSMRERLETYERWTRENELRRLMPAPLEEFERWEQIQGNDNEEGES